MNIHIKPESVCTGDVRWLEVNGDDAWEIMCDKLDPFKPFTTSDVALLFVAAYGYAYGTARLYARAVIKNTLAMDEGGLVKVTGKHYRFFGPEDEV
jgi:hypothetical protein